VTDVTAPFPQIGEGGLTILMAQRQEASPYALHVVRMIGWGAAAATVAALAVAAVASGSANPLAGTYRGTVDGASIPSPGEGCFTQKPTVYGKRVKPASGGGTICENEIIAPSLGPLVGASRGCNREPAILDTGGFPVQKAGFDYRGHAPIGPHGRELAVEFRGTWVSRTRIIGTTTISGGRCESKVRWTMVMSAPPVWP
jgi:hypothetical protein